jgi:hypothetical protein
MVDPEMRGPAAIKALVAIFFLCVLAAACGRQPMDAAPAISGALGTACERDGECASGFCDLKVCTAPLGAYGQACEPAPRGPDGLRDGKLNMCGAYVCNAGRCRSCTSDAECQGEYASPLCRKSDEHPGARCGR